MLGAQGDMGREPSSGLRKYSSRTQKRERDEGPGDGSGVNHCG
jgi:hypothetical protein